MFIFNKIFLFYFAFATTYTAYTMQKNTSLEDKLWQTIKQNLEKNNNHLHLAALNGNKTELTNIINQNNINDLATTYGLTPLMCAIASGNIDCVHFLLENGANINLHSTTGSHAIHIAARSGFLEIIKIIYKKNQELINLKNNKNNFTPLHFAAIKNRAKIFEWLLKKGANLKAEDDKGYNPMYYIAAFNQSHECAEISYKLDKEIINSVNKKNNFTPLHFAVQKNNHNMLQLLIEKKANIDVIDKKGNNLMHIAAFYGSHACAQIILNNNNELINSINLKNGYTPLHYAASENQINTLKEIFNLIQTTKHSVKKLIIWLPNSLMCNTNKTLSVKENIKSSAIILLLCKKKNIGMISCLPKPVLLMIIQMIYNPQEFISYLLSIKNNDQKIPYDLAKTEEIKALLKQFQLNSEAWTLDSKNNK